MSNPVPKPVLSGLHHRPCGTEVLIHTREIVTQPYDPTWPENVPSLAVPFCPQCNKLVPFTEVGGPQ